MEMLGFKLIGPKGLDDISRHKFKVEPHPCHVDAGPELLDSWI